MELATVQPSAVLGPLIGNDDPPSLRTTRGMLSGALPVCPPFGTGWADVRDVADLHLHAATDPGAAGERFIATSESSLRMVDIARILRDRMGDQAAKAPTRELPLFVARFVAAVNPAMGALRGQLGHDFDSRGTEAERMLGWTPRSVADSVQDTAESIIAHDPEVIR